MVSIVGMAAQIVGKEFNALLKRYFDEERPKLARGMKTGGMPSHHAQSTSMIVFYLIVTLVDPRQKVRS